MADPHTIVLEDLRSQFLVFGEALQGLREHMDARFANVDHELGLVKHDLGLVKHDLGLVKHDLGLVKHDLGLVKSVVLDHGRQLTLIRQNVETFGTKVDRSEVVEIVENELAKRR